VEAERRLSTINQKIISISAPSLKPKAFGASPPTPLNQILGKNSPPIRLLKLIYM